MGQGSQEAYISQSESSICLSLLQACKNDMLCQSEKPFFPLIASIEITASAIHLNNKIIASRRGHKDISTRIKDCTKKRKLLNGAGHIPLVQ